MLGSFEPAIGFATVPLPTGDGYTYTLTSLLGGFLFELEAAYGQRDREYTPLGMEFYGERPHLWYPGNRKHVSIILTDAARLNPGLAIFQLAHESLHLLAPTGGRHAPIIEEGLAILFCHAVSDRYGLGIRAAEPVYIWAEKQSQQLLALDPNVVRAARAVVSTFSKWEPDLLTTVCPKLPRALAARLCEPFREVEDHFLKTGLLPPA
jgi:hypothetical protein